MKTKQDNIQALNERSKKLELELISQLVFDVSKAKVTANLIRPEELLYFSEQYKLLLKCSLEDRNITIEFSSRGLSLTDFLSEFSIRKLPTICQEIREVSNARKAIFIFEDASLNVPSDKIFEYVSDIQKKLISSIEKNDTEKTDIGSLLKEYEVRQDFYREKFKNGNGIIGQSTGYTALDRAVDGLRPEHLWVIGGYTNTGKTAASLNIAAKLIKDGKRVVYYSLEMGQIDILARLIGIMSGEGGTDIIKGFGKNDIAILAAKEYIKESGLAIHSFRSELSELIFSMMEERTKQPVDLFVVDFIQLINVKESRSEYETITTATLELQKAAKRFKTPIIVLSQISNEGAKDSNSPVMSFKGSGAIAAAADLAIEIKSGETDRAELIRKLKVGEDVDMVWDIRKNRHGRVGAMDMTFNGKTGIFKAFEEEEKQQVENKKFGDW